MLQLPREIAEQAVTRINKKKSAQIFSGSAFLEFLACSSGCHHPTWQFCTQSEARSLVRSARSSLGRAKVEWGRRVTATEESLLDLGEADAEGAYSGGLVNRAIELYRKVLDKSKTFADRATGDLMAARCYAGLSRLSMNNDGVASDLLPEELARKGP